MPYRSPYPRFEIPNIDFTNFVFEKLDKFQNLIALEEEWSGRTLTFSQVKQLTQTVASALKSKGIRKGDVVCMYANNCLENSPLLFGSIAAGATVHLLKPFAAVYELSLEIVNCSPKFIITSSDRLETVEAVISKIDLNFDSIFITDIDHVKKMSMESTLYRSADELLLNSSDHVHALEEINFDLNNDVTLLQLSGGTTGVSKTIMNTHKCLVASLMAMEKTMGANSWLTGQCLLGYLPINLLYPLLSLYSFGLRYGIRILLMRCFDLETIMKNAATNRVSALHLIPPQVAFLANSDLIGKYDLSCWKTAYCGGAPIDEVCHKKLEDRMRLQNPDFQVLQGYGMTEYSGAISGPPTKGQYSKNKPGSVGMLVSNCMAKLIDLKSGKEIMEPNQCGELLINGPQIMKGYYKQPDLTSQTIQDGWLRTGDIGKFDSDGFLYVTDRIVDLIQCGKDKIFPSRLERILHTHPSVLDCAVVGREDEDKGEVPVAFVVLSSEGNKSDIIQFVNSSLTDVVPFDDDSMIVIDCIPRNPSKIMRNALRQRLMQG